jgi:hypothetical protein
MTEYEKMPLHQESERAPKGICEISIQAPTYKAFDYEADMTSALNNYVEKNFDVKAFEYSANTQNDRLVVYTGTDRLDIASLRDIAEVYGQVSNYSDGNIPPDLSLVPTSRRGDKSDYFVWLEFKLEMELPHEEVEHQVEVDLGGVEFTPKNPVGENSEAILFRDKNVANHQVREILNRCRKISDNLPIDYIRLVCEPKR